MEIDKNGFATLYIGYNDDGNLRCGDAKNVLHGRMGKPTRRCTEKVSVDLYNAIIKVINEKPGEALIAFALYEVLNRKGQSNN